MKNYKICVYAICKNESKFVRNWITSMSEADYICILDTGSTDDTYDLIKAIADEYEHQKNPCKIIYSQKVYTPWRFDTPRVDSMKLCPIDTDIFVCTDLDEMFEPGWAEPLRKYWDPDKYDMVSYLYTWSHLENGEAGRVFRYNKIHGKGFTWKFPVHESLCREVDADLREENKSLRYLNLDNMIMLHHYPDTKKSRSNYLPLLELRAKEYPDDTFGLIYLAHEYSYRGMYQNSIDTLDSIIAGDDYKRMSSEERSSCYFFRGDNYKGLGDRIQALKDYYISLDLDPTLREPYLKIASVFIELKLYDDAIKYAKLAIKNGVRHYSWLEKNCSWTYDPYDIMSIASFYAGYKRDSLAYAYKAYSYDNKNERLKNNIDLILNNMTEEEMIN